MGHVAYLLVFLLVAVSFQNCSPVRFMEAGSLDGQSLTTEEPPSGLSCDPLIRPPDSEPKACLAPNSNIQGAVQRYSVICQNNGEWLSTANGAIDYAGCPQSCSGDRPSDFENVACPAPNSQEIKAVQRYTVICEASGNWSRTVTGTIDYQLCPSTCDSATKPPSTEAISCPAPNAGIKSGIQNYNVVCGSNGQWSRQLGASDYSQCPQTCDASSRPTDREKVKCPQSNAYDATQYYSVTCSAGAQWQRTPSNLDTSACVAATCDPATKPATSMNVACLAPHASQKLAMQTIAVSCTGTTWVSVPGAIDYSACPTGCTATKPADDSSAVACAAPYSSQMLAKQNYTYVCNSSQNTYTRTAVGSVDYSACPKACTGAAPASRLPIACPAGQTGTGYQNYNVSCNTGTGQWQVSTGTTDYSGCTSPSVSCPGGSSSVNSAANNVGAVNTCSFTWPTVTYSASNPTRTFNGTPAGTLTATCSSTGAWTNVTTTCPAPTNVTYTYAWDPSSVTNSGSCSATACGTTGTQSRVYTVCRRNDGVVVAGSYCGSNVAPAISCSAPACPVVSCVGGSTSVNSAPNNVGTVNTCSFNWPTVTYNPSNSYHSFTGTNGGTLAGSCTASGAWANVTSNCPAPAPKPPLVCNYSCWGYLIGGDASCPLYSPNPNEDCTGLGAE